MAASFIFGNLICIIFIFYLNGVIKWQRKRACARSHPYYAAIQNASEKSKTIQQRSYMNNFDFDSFFFFCEFFGFFFCETPYRNIQCINNKIMVKILASLIHYMAICFNEVICLWLLLLLLSLYFLALWWHYRKKRKVMYIMGALFVHIHSYILTQWPFVRNVSSILQGKSIFSATVKNYIELSIDR